MKDQIYFKRNLSILININKMDKNLIYDVINSKSLNFKDLSVNQFEKLSIMFDVNLYDLIYTNLLKKDIKPNNYITNLTNINDINQIYSFIKIKNNYLDMIELKNK